MTVDTYLVSPTPSKAGEITMKGYEMRRTKVKPLVTGPHLSFSYPVPPYMYLRMIVRKEIVFMPRARILMDMLNRFELRDLVARHTWCISSSRPTARNNIPVAHSPGWDQKVMLSNEKRTSSGDAHKRHLNHGYAAPGILRWRSAAADGIKEGSDDIHWIHESVRMRNTEDEESSTFEEATLKFRHFDQHKAKVTDKVGKQLCKQDSTIIAKPLNSNEDNLDIHMFSVLGPIPKSIRPTPTSPSILEKFLEDDMFRSILEDFLGDSGSLSELESFVNDSESFSRIERFPEASASHPNMARLWEGAASSPTLRERIKEHNMRKIESLGSVNKLPVALTLSGTNSYLGCNTPPSLTLETLEKALDKVDDDSGKRFLFWQGMENNTRSFESVLHPGYYLCTHTGQAPSSLELWNNPQRQKAISEFQVST